MSDRESAQRWWARGIRAWRDRQVTATPTASLANLEDLRQQLTTRIALLAVAASGLTVWLALPQYTIATATIAARAIPLGTALVIWRLSSSHPRLARHLLVWGFPLLLAGAMWQSDAAWLPFVSLLLAFTNAMLLPGSEVATAAFVVATAAWLGQAGGRAYPLPGLVWTLAFGVGLAWLIRRTLYTALQWAWNMQQQANHLLSEVRDRQGELSRALKSVELANIIQRRTQRELAEARRQAEEARRMKEQFAANVSHELRTPLNLILGFSELMYLSPEVYGEVTWSPTLRRDIYQIYRNSRHLSEMIDDILDLSRFEMVGFTLNQEPTPLGPLLRDAAEIAADLFRGRPVRLEVDLPPDLPTLVLDRTRIRQVLLNLLGNAQRFTEAGYVRLTARQQAGEVVISVSDTGPGIAADQIPRLFDEFYQVDHSLRRSHGGTGLGLAISQRFIQAHQGRIWVESQVGVGSTFSFALPIPGQTAPASDIHMERPVDLPLPAGRPRILVVDPDARVADLVRRHLPDYEVMLIEEPTAVDQAIDLHHPRAVIHNVAPEGERGEGILSASPVPWITCSLPSQAWLARELAVTCCLTKPITGAQLLAAIERVGAVREALIIDDDRGFCQLVERILTTSGREFILRRAYDGTEGLLEMRNHPPDLVLLDLIMPGIDGFHVLDAMKRSPELASIPVIVLTATSYAEDALARRGNRIVVERRGGFRPAEALRCLRALIGVLEPHYDKRDSTDQV